MSSGKWHEAQVSINYVAPWLPLCGTQKRDIASFWLKQHEIIDVSVCRHSSQRRKIIAGIDSYSHLASPLYSLHYQSITPLMSFWNGTISTTHYQKMLITISILQTTLQKTAAVPTLSGMKYPIFRSGTPKPIGIIRQFCSKPQYFGKNA